MSEQRGGAAVGRGEERTMFLFFLGENKNDAVWWVRNLAVERTREGLRAELARAGVGLRIVGSGF